MKIYLDLVFVLNFCFDFILLLSVSIILKRNISFKRILLGALIGGISIFSLFLRISSFVLFIFKCLISIIMVLTTFSYKNIKYTVKNISYLYMNSLILGGFLYFLNTQFSYKHEGLVFYYKGLSINFIFLIIFSPIIIYIYIRQVKEIKNNYNLYHKVNIYYQNKVYKVTGYLDTGNKLVDPLTKKPVVILNEKVIKSIGKYRYIPYQTINGEGLIRCINTNIEIDKHLKKNILVGLVEKIKMEGIDCILNQSVIK